jgi:hypothetical protein
VRIKKSFGDKSLDELMTRLSAARASAGGSPVQWHGFAFQLLIPVFESAVEFQGSVSETDRGELIRDAIFGAATETKFDREALLRHLRRAENSYLQKPPQKFILATSWTASPGLKMKPVRSDRAMVSFSPLSRTRLDREPIRNLVEKVMPFPVPEMLQVQAQVTARTPSGAFELGQHAVDYARGVWNFLINRRTAFRWSDTHKPVNELLPGPIHTVHTSRGKPALEIVWYELYRVDQLQLFGNGALLNKLEDTALKVRKWVRESDYARDIEHGFVRYTRALDSPDHATAFARLWTAIEYLADTSDHERLVRRIAFLSSHEERGFVDIVLRHMRDVRNGVVHVDASREHTDMRGGMEVYLFQLKVFAEWLLRFHLRNGRKYKTRASAVEFLDTPANPEELRRLIRLYRSVLRHRLKVI